MRLVVISGRNFLHNSNRYLVCSMGIALWKSKQCRTKKPRRSCQEKFQKCLVGILEEFESDRMTALQGIPANVWPPKTIPKTYHQTLNQLLPAHTLVFHTLTML